MSKHDFSTTESSFGFFSARTENSSEQQQKKKSKSQNCVRNMISKSIFIKNYLKIKEQLWDTSENDPDKTLEH